MRRHLYVKFLLAYLVFGILGFLTIAFFFRPSDGAISDPVNR